jgi:hypothetical protein
VHVREPASDRRSQLQYAASHRRWRHDTAGGVCGGLSLWPAATVLAVEPLGTRARKGTSTRMGRSTHAVQSPTLTHSSLPPLAISFVRCQHPAILSCSLAKIGNIVWWIIAHVVVIRKFLVHFGR